MNGQIDKRLTNWWKWICCGDPGHWGVLTFPSAYRILLWWWNYESKLYRGGFFSFFLELHIKVNLEFLLKFETYKNWKFSMLYTNLISCIGLALGSEKFCCFFSNFVFKKIQEKPFAIILRRRRVLQLHIVI